MALSMILDQAKAFGYSGVSLLLDQEKAYDRVHPGYLGQVLQRFGFPTSFVDCVETLFFGNHVYVNINGFFTKTIKQERGLRQGDPLSPLLFNLALEPFLLSLLQDTSFQGFHFGPQSPAVPSPVSPVNIKCLAYADDVCAFLTTEEDFRRLQVHMQNYESVSNSKFNEDKTEAFSLNGKRDVGWENILSTWQITTYHHQGSVSAFRYLGFYLPYNQAQRAIIEEQLVNTVKVQCALYSQRQLSIRGRVTVMNILILSKIWYTLRLLKPTKKFLASLRTMAYQFIWQKKHPRLRKDIIFLPWQSGGLKVLDPMIQHQLLQKRRIIRIA